MFYFPDALHKQLKVFSSGMLKKLKFQLLVSNIPLRSSSRSIGWFAKVRLVRLNCNMLIKKCFGHYIQLRKILRKILVYFWWIKTLCKITMNYVNKKLFKWNRIVDRRLWQINHFKSYFSWAIKIIRMKFNSLMYNFFYTAL